jgi:predicted dehydrogenase/threonine dehydrogenase-like Zn-dependent dehydrogenase
VKQILQHLKDGAIELAEVPAPGTRPGAALIRTTRTLISSGTERMLLDFGRAGWLDRARQQPDKVNQVLDKIRADGLLPTLDAVSRKLDEPLPLGYCHVGILEDAGCRAGDPAWAPGTRIASNGPHAEWASVPHNLCARIPDSVSDDEASFTVLGAIALQGIRLVTPALGERIVVYGLGLIGLLTVQLLRAHGCEVLGIDLNPARMALAARYGARTVDGGAGDPVGAVLAWTNGAGADAVLITASARTDEIAHQAALMSRKRGRIVLVGVVGLNLRRDDFYKKELSFQVSCSYGPGRYDEAYEEGGKDYPLPFVRWTQQRNFEAVLGAMAGGQLDVKPLITHRFAHTSAAEAYQALSADAAALGILIEYAPASDRTRTVTLRPSEVPAGGEPVIGFLGAGGFARAVLLPALAKTGARLAWVGARSGTAAATHAAKKHGAERVTSDYREVLADPAVNAVFIATRHDSHAALVCDALRAGRNVFVEKPLCLTRQELTSIESVMENIEPALRPRLMVGFNRRFSPHVQAIHRCVARRSQPVCMTMLVNAGEIPSDHWIQDPARGGGRIIGEGCHFIDLMAFLAGAPITRVTATMAGGGLAVKEDKMAIQLAFADGSVGSLQYFANGAKAYPKETLEVFSEGRVFRLDNFRRTEAVGARGFRSVKTWRQDKGHDAEVATFLEAVKMGAPSPIPFAELVNVTRATFAAVESAKNGRAVEVAAG